MTPPDRSGTTAPNSARRPTKRSQEAAERLRKALAHPVRMRVLMRLSQAELSPNLLAQELEERLGTVAYHVRVLNQLGYLELVRREQRRGAYEHFYRARTRAFLSDADWGRLPRKTREALSDSVLQVLWDDVARSLALGSFDERLDRHLSFTTLVLDEAAWARLREEVNRVLDLAIELQAESAARLQDGQAGGGEVMARLAALLYTAPAPSS